jgi:hypothetical protein
MSSNQLEAALLAVALGCIVFAAVFAFRYRKRGADLSRGVVPHGILALLLYMGGGITLIPIADIWGEETSGLTLTFAGFLAECFLFVFALVLHLVARGESLWKDPTFSGLLALVAFAGGFSSVVPDVLFVGTLLRDPAGIFDTDPIWIGIFLGAPLMPVILWAIGRRRDRSVRRSG